MFALSKFDIRYQPAKAVKGQALADLTAKRVSTNIVVLSVRAWAMYFDGSVCRDGCGIGILLVSPRGATYSFSIRLPTTCTNNLAEYEAVHKGMKLLLEAEAEVEVFGDSKLVIYQLTEEYRCESELLFPLWMQCQELIAQFRYINFYWIPRARNSEANGTTGFRIQSRRIQSSGAPTGPGRLESRYLQLLEGFGSGGTQEDML
jgi:ribonuclease HI